MSARKDSNVPPLAPPDLILTRVLDAPRELVFKVWTDPHHLAKWWGPNGFTNPICEVALRPGGALRIHMRGPDGTVYPMTGIYREVVAPERLVYGSSALDENGKALFEVLQTVTFSEEGEKTRLTVAIQIISTTPAGAPHLQGQREGWSQSLDRLAAYLEENRRTFS